MNFHFAPNIPSLHWMMHGKRVEDMLALGVRVGRWMHKQDRHLRMCMSVCLYVFVCVCALSAATFGLAVFSSLLPFGTWQKLAWVCFVDMVYTCCTHTRIHTHTTIMPICDCAILPVVDLRVYDCHLNFAPRVHLPPAQCQVCVLIERKATNRHRGCC